MAYDDERDEDELPEDVVAGEPPLDLGIEDDDPLAVVDDEESEEKELDAFGMHIEEDEAL